MNSGITRQLVQRLTGAEALDPETEGAALQEVSESYWRSSTNTYLGNRKFYARREEALEWQLRRLSACESALDIGCGDGRYTLQIAAHVKQVEGRDISPTLIEAAVERARAAGVENVRFVTAAADEALPEQAFDLVCALGVTSCIVDDQRFTAFLKSVAGACRPGAYLVTIDSLSRWGDALNRFPDGYVARYRTRRAYTRAIRAAGFDLLEQYSMGSPASGLARLLPVRRRMNRMFVFVRATD